MLVLCASSAVWGLQLHVACVLLRAGGAAFAGSGVCLAVPRWVWEAVEISGLILFKSKQKKNTKKNNDCSDCSCSTLQCHFWIEIKRWEVCLTLQLIPCSSDSSLTRDSLPLNSITPLGESRAGTLAFFPPFRGSGPRISITRPSHQLGLLLTWMYKQLLGPGLLCSALVA